MGRALLHALTCPQLLALPDSSALPCPRRRLSLHPLTVWNILKRSVSLYVASTLLMISSRTCRAGQQRRVQCSECQRGVGSAGLACARCSPSSIRSRLQRGVPALLSPNAPRHPAANEPAAQTRHTTHHVKSVAHLAQQGRVAQVGDDAVRIRGAALVRGFEGRPRRGAQQVRPEHLRQVWSREGSSGRGGWQQASSRRHVDRRRRRQRGASAAARRPGYNPSRLATFRGIRLPRAEWGSRKRRPHAVALGLRSRRPLWLCAPSAIAPAGCLRACG